MKSNEILFCYLYSACWRSVSELISTSPHWLFWGRSSILRDDDPSLEGRTRTLSTLLSLVCWDPQVSRHRDWWRQRRSVTSLYISHWSQSMLVKIRVMHADPHSTPLTQLLMSDSLWFEWFHVSSEFSCLRHTVSPPTAQLYYWLQSVE